MDLPHHLLFPTATPEEASKVKQAIGDWHKRNVKLNPMQDSHAAGQFT